MEEAKGILEEEHKENEVNPLEENKENEEIQERKVINYQMQKLKTGWYPNSICVLAVDEKNNFDDKSLKTLRSLYSSYTYGEPFETKVGNHTYYQC